MGAGKDEAAMTRRWLLAVLSLWIAASLAAAPQTSPPSGDAPTVQGRIIARDTSAPIARARVTVVSSGRAGGPVFSDADGRFAAEVPAGGTFRLRVAKSGFITQELAGSASVLAETNVLLVRGAAVSGRVVDADGQPAAGAAVRVRPVDGGPFPAGAPDTSTDDIGEFRIAGLAPGRYVVTGGGESMRCTDSGNGMLCSRTAAATEQVELREGQETTVHLTIAPAGPLTTLPTAALVSLEARARGVVRGRVMTANGVPAAGVSVALWRSAFAPPAGEAGFRITGVMGAITGGDGRYEILRVPAGSFLVSVSRADVHFPASIAGSPHSNTIALGEGENLDGIDISISNPGAITGTIVDEIGEPIEGLIVRALRARYAGGHMVLDAVPDASARTTDDRGRYRIFGLRPGSYYVVASEAPSAVVPGGKPLHASLHVFYPGRPSAAEALPLHVEAEAVVAGVDLTFAPHRGGRITGRAQLSSGRPVRGTAILAGSVRSGTLAPEPRAVPIGDGRFEFLHVPPGEYAVQVVGWKTWEVSEEFGSALVRVGGEESLALAITTAPPSSLSGTIRFQGASASVSPSDVRLRTLPADPDSTPALPSVEPALAEHADVRPDGRFTITGLVGSRRLTATAPDGWWLRSAVVDGIDVADDPFVFGAGAVRRTNVDVVFADGAVTISGRVTNSRMEPLAGYPVVAFPTDSSRIYHHSRYLGITHSDRTGHYSLANLPPGDYSVVAVDAPLAADDWQHPGVLSGLAIAARRVAVTQGGRATVNLQPTPLTP
jgi:protocatechuate 3,4-dioxygenase beta subunit